MREALVYAIRGTTTGLVKIGVSEDPDRRLRDLQSGSPDELVLVGTCTGGYELEHRLHEFLSAHRRHGEWFAPAVETLAVVGAVVIGDVTTLGPRFKPWAGPPEVDWSATHREAAATINGLVFGEMPSGLTDDEAMAWWDAKARDHDDDLRARAAGGDAEAARMIETRERLEAMSERYR